MWWRRRVNDSGAVSENFRAALDATAVRVSSDQAILNDPDTDEAVGAARGGICYNLWAALLQTHLKMIVSVRPPATRNIKARCVTALNTHPSL